MEKKVTIWCLYMPPPQSPVFWHCYWNKLNYLWELSGIKQLVWQKKTSVSDVFLSRKSLRKEEEAQHSHKHTYFQKKKHRQVGTEPSRTLAKDPPWRLWQGIPVDGLLSLLESSREFLFLSTTFALINYFEQNIFLEWSTNQFCLYKQRARTKVNFSLDLWMVKMSVPGRGYWSHLAAAASAPPGSWRIQNLPRPSKSQSGARQSPDSLPSEVGGS